MAFLTEEFLREKAQERNYNKFVKALLRKKQKEGRILEKSASETYIKKSKQEAEVTVFLSHSHKDKELVEGFIQVLDEQGISVYVDWNDTEMPRITNGETAIRIKEKIKELDLFMLLATENALSSRWCPWELGVADSSKDWKKILIIPVADKSGKFKGNEYLRIYRFLDKDLRVIEIKDLRVTESEVLFLEIASYKHPPISLYEYLSAKGSI